MRFLMMLLLLAPPKEGKAPMTATTGAFAWATTTQGPEVVFMGREDAVAYPQAINIYPSGRVVLPEGSDVDEQAKRFWAAIQKYAPAMRPPCKP